MSGVPLSLDECPTFLLNFFTALEKVRLKVLATPYTFLHHGSPLCALLRMGGSSFFLRLYLEANV